MLGRRSPLLPGAPGGCAVTLPSECRLPNSPTAPYAARDFVRRMACPRHLANVDDACLLVSEVVTNALLHGAPPLALTCRCVGTAVLFSVSDHRPQRAPLASHPAGNDDEGGRGLAIVELLAAQWGVHDDAGGKSVWFLLDNTPLPPA